MKWKFRRGLFGKQVLQISARTPTTPYGDFASYWKDATQDEANEFTVEMKLLMEKLDIVKKMKNEHPEYFLIN